MTLLSGFSRWGWLFPMVQANPHGAVGKSGAEQQTAGAKARPDFRDLLARLTRLELYFKQFSGKGPTSVGPLCRPDWLALQRLW